MDYKLPQPTDEELNMTGKSFYFERILEMDLHKKYKIPFEDLTSWIHHNYTSIFITFEELTYKQFKKLTK